MQPQRKYRLGTVSNNYRDREGWLNRFYWYQTFILIFRRGLYNLFGCSARMEVS